jgi:GNAT superfamily N-acetyltransferase
MTIRGAKLGDEVEIFNLIRELAIFEKMEDQLIANAQMLKENLFDNKNAHSLVIEEEGEIIAYAIYFFSFSTFLSKKGLFLEDLYVKEAKRGQGLGKKLLSAIAKIAVDEECGRMEWTVLDWNTPAREFYKTLGAETMDTWLINRVSGESLANLAAH